MTARLALFVLFIFAALGQSVNERPQEILDRAIADFQHSRIAQAVDGFDRVAKLVPGYAPQLWQRGIALYYAGRFKDCRVQFESHRTVNPDDVENAAWHFLCVARSESVEKAKRSLLPVGPDSRVPIREIYEMFRGKYTPEQVLRAAGDGIDAQFYAYLYSGLYYEALGDRERALRQVTEPAADRFSAAGYMHGVARVHRDLLNRARPATP
jgi:lipoprotein NlpI